MAAGEKESGFSLATLSLYVLMVAMIGMHFWYSASVDISGIHIYVVDGAVLLVYVAAGLRVLAGGRPKVGLVGYSLIAMIGMLLVAAVIGAGSDRPLQSVLNDLKTGLYLATYFPATVLLRSWKDVDRLLKFSLVLVVAAAIYDVNTRLGGPNYYPQDASAVEVYLSSGTVSRAFGLITAPAYYGIALAFVAAAVVVQPMALWKRWALIAIATLLLVLDVVQLLRGVLVGLAVFGAVFAVFVFATGGRKAINLGLYIFALAFVGTLVVLALNAAGSSATLQPLIERVASIVDPNASTTHAAATGAQRLDFVVGVADDLGLRGQLLFGRGLGYGLVDRETSVAGVPVFYPTLAYHSAAGWLLSKTGIAGSALFGFLVTSFVVRTAVVYGRLKDPRLLALFLGGIGAFMFLLATSLAENYLLQYPFTVPLAGMLLAVPEVAAAPTLLAQALPRVARVSPLAQPTAGVASLGRT